ncbi:basic proline-rich protein-like [Falco peregrinus]|uniref:basic proline-rich protein-like n=1 Tax=Falco peregrinus TaxID=8954 RepID=UPI00247AAFD0|nr:basic proline-rich protein-like [Falco peregrinus]
MSALSPRRASTSGSCPLLTARRKRRMRVRRGARAGGGSGRWSPLHGARLEEMVREATRLAAQLEQCHLSPLGTPRPPQPPPRDLCGEGQPGAGTAAHRGAAGTPPRPPPGPPPSPGVPPLPPPSPAPGRCHPAVTPQRCPRDPPGARVPPPNRLGPPRPCPAQGQGAAARGKSEPLQVGTAGQPKVRGGAAPCPPATRQPRTRATTVPVPSSRPPAPSAIPRAPGRTLAGGGCTGWEGTRGQRCGGGTGSPPRPLARGANPDLPPAASAPPGRRR